MKTMIAITLLLISHLIAAQPVPGTLTVVIKDVKGAKGKVSIGLFNDAKVFMKKRIDSRSVQAQNGEVTLQFEHLPEGEYAITVMHDENGNGELDSNFVGIPVEGFGFSNDAKAMFGPPSYDKCVFHHQADQQITIHLKYF
ncbi:MAG TPA: DUF2141 domain-containing protein [Cyclobacteriaceae bacterium]|nr:DUF2141 domain-containing protein [Cyclobacteriaceae bacterium]